MAIAEVFPYSDQHNLNLDWIITKIKEFSGNQISAIACQQIDADTIKFIITYTDGSTKELTEIDLPAGPKGDKGDQGQKGDTGTAATVSIGTVSTLPAGSDATVTDSGTSSASILNFGIPQGATGSPGEVIEQIVPVEATTTSSRAYSTGDYFVNNLGILVQATTNIASGATIDSTNSTAVNETLADQVSEIQTSLNDSGTNYIKLPDGTLIQFGYISLGSHTTTQTGALYTTDWTLGVNEGVFPITFVGSYALTVAPTDGSFQIITSLESTTSKITKIGGGRPTSGNVNGNFRYIAIGKWK